MEKVESQDKEAIFRFSGSFKNTPPRLRWAGPRLVAPLIRLRFHSVHHPRRVVGGNGGTERLLLAVELEKGLSVPHPPSGPGTQNVG